MRMRHRRVHRRIWTAIALLLPWLFLGALALRPGGPTEQAPQRIAAPKVVAP
jgi:hypothetical protein